MGLKPAERDKNPKAALIFLVALILLAIQKFYFHEMWKDEWQAWLLATRTESLNHLFSFLPGEGHPSFWFLILRAWNGMFDLVLNSTADWFRLQLLHFILTAITLWVLIFRVKVPLWKKLLFGCGYYLLFEYSVVARPYILLVLLGLLLLTSYHSLRNGGRFQQLKTLIVFFLLTQTEVYGIFIAAGFLILFGVELTRLNGKRTVGLFAILSVFLFGVLLFYLQIQPGDTSQSIAVNEATTKSLFRILADPFHSLTINTFLPGITDTVFRAGPSVLSIVGGVVLFAGLLFLFRKDKVRLFAFASMFLMFYLFAALFYLGGVRNWGLLWLGFMLILLAGKNEIEDWKDYSVLIAIGLTHLIHGVNVYITDLGKPFSNAKEAGAFVTNEIPAEVPIIGLNKVYCVPVIGYSGRSFTGFPEKKNYSFFSAHDWRGKAYLPSAEELAAFRMAGRHNKVVVVYNKPLDLRRYPGLRPLKKFDAANLRKESYYFYYY